MVLTRIVKKITPFVTVAGLSLLPFAEASAQAFQGIITLTDQALVVVNTLVTAVFVIAVLVFGWGIVKYLTAAGDAAKIKDARQFLWWGLIGMFVLAAMFGLIKFISDNLLGTGGLTGGTINIPIINNPTR